LNTTRAQPNALASARHSAGSGSRRYRSRSRIPTSVLGLCDKTATLVQAGTAWRRSCADCEDFGCKLVEFNGETEHIHLLVNLPPTVALSRLVNSLKGVSSRRLRQEFPDLARHYWRTRRLWSESYFAGSVEVPR